MDLALGPIAASRPEMIDCRAHLMTPGTTTFGVDVITLATAGRFFYCLQATLRVACSERTVWWILWDHEAGGQLEDTFLLLLLLRRAQKHQLAPVEWLIIVSLPVSVVVNN